MAIDLGTAGLLEQMAAGGGKPLHESTPEEARAFGEALGAMAGPAPAMARVQEHVVAVTDGEVPVRVLVPLDSPAGVIVYYHGGGWVIGTIDEFDTIARKLAERTSCAVVLVDYRLAPEHRYPTAVDDSYAALEWVSAHMDEIAGADVPLMVAGDSAGGNIAAVMAVRARDRNGPSLDLQVLIYPVTDADFERKSYVDPENQLLLTRDAMIWFWDHYVPDASRRSEPDASPLQTPDLSGLPPAVVLTAEYDPLRDEGEAYARKLEEHGVDVSYRQFDGQIHGFFTLLQALPASADARQFIVAQIRQALDGASVDSAVSA